MIDVWYIDPSQHKFDQTHLDAYPTETGFIWYNVTDPTDEDLKTVAEKTQTTQITKKQRPKLNDYGNYTWIVYKIPNHDESTIVHVLITKGTITTVTPKGVLKKISHEPQTMTKFTFSVFDKLTSKYFKPIEQQEEQIDQLEKEVLGEPQQKSLNRIFKIKKILLQYRKALNANRAVITSIEKGYCSQLDKEELKYFRDVYTDIGQLIELEGTYRDVLTGSLDVYLSSVNNNLNKVMKTLTVISAFVLIPTLISGIYGMNFSKESMFNMPELYWKYGYFFALGLMLLSIITTYTIFKRKKWL